MSYDLWAAFALASFILLIIPGPTILLVVSYAIGLGRKEALAMVAGVALGDFLAMTATLLGLGAMMLASATLFTVMKWGGALYLVWMGFRLIKTAAHSPAKLESVSQKTPYRAFADAAIVTLLNPKSIGFFVAFVPQFITPDAPLLPQFSIMIVTFVGLGSLNALAYALLAGHARTSIRQPHILAWMQRLGGTLLIGLAALTATLKRV